MASINNTIELSHSVLQSTAIRAQQPSIPNPNLSQQQPNHFLFQGDEASFSQQVKRMSEEDIDRVLECDICIIGEEVKPANLKCLIITLLIGICLVFPLFFFCCQWWKRAVSQIFQIKQQTYKEIGRLLKGKNVKNVNIKVYDNFFTQEKIKVLARSLNKREKVSKLVVINEAGAFDMNDNEYSNFLRNAKPFLKLTLKDYYIGWYKQQLKNGEI